MAEASNGGASAPPPPSSDTEKIPQPSNGGTSETKKNVTPGEGGGGARQSPPLPSSPSSESPSAPASALASAPAPTTATTPTTATATANANANAGTAFLIYCFIPISLLLLTSWINEMISGGGGGGGGGAGPSPPPHVPPGGEGKGVTIDLDAARRAGAIAGSGGGGVGGDGKKKKGNKKKRKDESELSQEIDALLEKRGKKLPDKDRGRKRHEKSDDAASWQGDGNGGAIDIAAARKRAQQQMDPRRKFDEQVDKIRDQYKSNPSDVFRALALADALRQRDLTFHDGGSVQFEAIDTYNEALELIRTKRRRQIEAGEATNVPLSGESAGGLNSELFMDMTARSTDGLLASVECSLGKMYFMANMFEKAVEAYDRALELDDEYLDALCYRGSTLIILGRYEEAAVNYLRALELDSNRIFQDTYTGLAKILVAKESAVPGGWDPLVQVLEVEIPKSEMRLASVGGESSAQQKGATDMVRDGLKRMHLAMFSYHDSKTKDTERAWHHLSSGYKHKMAALAPWNRMYEKQRVEAVKQVFHQGFWPAGVGSQSRVPVFIIGFVRSGSTLTERVLDAHPLVVGTGEDSVFNGRLDQIRNEIVESSMSANPNDVRTTVKRLADMVVEGMRERWKVIDAAIAKDEEEVTDGKKKSKPKRFVDKMLTNYMNVGFIHMLFPKALILHVARNPMDTCFSAFKHDFPPGTLDYTSDFPSLADLYHGYRDVMEHWDAVLPGRVTHIRYEDMVNDMPGVARGIIDAARLEWDPEVLKFHEKKHAVNTLSTTQVRKGVYKHHLQAWKKYEGHLQPLVKLLGDRTEFSIKTTLPGYKPPSQDEVKE